MATTTFTDQVTVVEASWLNDVNDHVYQEQLTDAHSADKITVTPVGGVAATNVQSAIQELDSEKQNASDNLTTYASVAPTIAGLALLDDADASAQRTTLGLGTMAVETASNYAKKTADGDINMSNYKVSGLKTATFNSQSVLSTTTGAVAIDWSAAQNYKQNEPTGAITYTFTNPPGVCHLQLVIDSDGTSTAQVITWPASVVWFTSTWAGVNNKKAIINFWFDGTNYFAMGANQV